MERAKIDDLHCHHRCQVVFRLDRGQRDRLLELRLPVNRSSAIVQQITGRRPARAAIPPVRVAVSIQANESVMTVVGYLR